MTDHKHTATSSAICGDESTFNTTGMYSKFPKKSKLNPQKIIEEFFPIIFTQLTTAQNILQEIFTFLCKKNLKDEHCQQSFEGQKKWRNFNFKTLLNTFSLSAFQDNETCPYNYNTMANFSDQQFDENNQNISNLQEKFQGVKDINQLQIMFTQYNKTASNNIEDIFAFYQQLQHQNQQQNGALNPSKNENFNTFRSSPTFQENKIRKISENSQDASENQINQIEFSKNSRSSPELSPIKNEDQIHKYNEDLDNYIQKSEEKKQETDNQLPAAKIEGISLIEEQQYSMDSQNKTQLLQFFSQETSKGSNKENTTMRQKQLIQHSKSLPIDKALQQNNNLINIIDNQEQQNLISPKLDYLPLIIQRNQSTKLSQEIFDKQQQYSSINDNELLENSVFQNKQDPMVSSTSIRAGQSMQKLELIKTKLLNQNQLDSNLQYLNSDFKSRFTNIFQKIIIRLSICFLKW